MSSSLSTSSSPPLQLLPPSSPPITEVDETLSLIPGLPDDLSALILSRVPYSHHSRIKSTCKSWRNFLSSKILFFLRRIFLPTCSLSHLICFFPEDPSISSPYLFDPQRLVWRPLPPMPINPHVYGLCNFTSVSIGHHLYVLGGSLFDTRSFPLESPSPSSAAFRFDFSTASWERISPMLTPRGSFACAVIPDSDQIVVAGGGSRHTMFGAAGSRIKSVERYDIEKNEWVMMDEMPKYRAGCTGFYVGNGEERQFWVMGGYGESRMISGILSVDEYKNDAVVMELKDGGERWREVGDMWSPDERRKLGQIAVIEPEENGGVLGIFMLDDSHEIYRYDMSSNRWSWESSLIKKPLSGMPMGFIALNGELHVITFMRDINMEVRRSRVRNNSRALYLQIYCPGTKRWRSLLSRPGFNLSLDFNTAVMCTVRL